MQKIFVEARANLDLKLSKADIAKLPKRIGLLTTVQHIHRISELKKEIEKTGREVFLSEGKKTKYPGQVLGCDVHAAESIKGKVDAFLYVGSGKFHPLGIALAAGKPVFCFNPYSKKFEQLDESEVEKIKKRRKGAVVKFLDAKNIGILASIKPGQFMLKEALELKKKLKKTGKEGYVLLFDTLDFGELENFPFIECFINMACPRITEDYALIKKPIANYKEIEQYLK